MTTCWELVRMLGGRQTSDRALQSSLSADTDLSQFLITLGNLAGVRIALYLQVYFNFILVRSSNIDYAAAAWAMTTTFWAFFAAAVDLWRRNELTMLQAIVTSFLLSLHAASGILCIVGTYSTQRPRRPPTLPAIVLSIILSNAGAGAFGIAVALEGKQMGPNLDCNRNMNITVGFHRALSGQGDGLKWTLFSINLVYISICLVIFIFQIAIWIYRKGWQHGKMTPDCLVWTHYHFKRNGRKPYDVPYLQGNEFLHYRIEWIALVLECLWYSVIVHVELILVNNDIRKTTFGFGQVSTT